MESRDTTGSQHTLSILGLGSRPAPLIVAALAAALIFSGFARGVPRAYDLPDHLGSIWQVLHGFERGNFYPRWLADFNAGFGEATLVFYPPLLYFLSAALAWLFGGDVLTGLYVTLFFFTVLGGVGIFLFVRRVFGPGAAAGACLLFAFLPYRVFEMYASGLYSAFAAACLMPWALMALARIAEAGGEAREGGRSGSWALLFALIALTNMPSAVFFAYLAGVWVVIEFLASRRWKVVSDVILGGAWGCLIAAVYLLPAALETRWIDIPLESAYQSNFLFQSHGSWMKPGLKSLFDRMGLFPMLALVLSLGLLAAARKRQMASDRRAGIFLRMTAAFGLASLFLVTPLSIFAWRWVPQLGHVNMPWRLLEPLGLATASGTAAALLLLWRGRGFPMVLKASAFFFFACLAAVSLVFDASISAVNGQMPAKSCRAAIPSYARKECFFFPKGARRPREMLDAPLVACDSPCRVEVLDWSATRRRARVLTESGSRIALRTYFFPGWKAERVGSRREPLPIRAEPGTGRIAIDVPAGDNRIDVLFTSTPERIGGGVISLLAVSAWAVAAWRSRRTAGEPVSSESESTRV